MNPISLKTYAPAVVLLVCTCVFPGFGQNKEIRVTIDLSETYQAIDNFGASDAWGCQFAGNWPDEKKEKIADLLFSNLNYPDGSPKGIGLTMWRFNIGSGSAEQGEKSGIRDEWRRAESFLNDDGSYNWQKQKGQIWFLKAAKKRGVSQFLAFTNSPPVQFTVNGKAFATQGKTNISMDRYGDFAGFLARTIKGIQRLSRVNIGYISPVNEPQWDWSDGGQEGCPYDNVEIAGLVKSISNAFSAAKISSGIIIGEAGKIDYLLSMADKPRKGNQIREFFNPASASYIGNVPGLVPIITAHSYFTTSPASFAVNLRSRLRDSIGKITGLRFWQSEYCILGNNNGEINGSKRDLGINAALYVAKVIHRDLAIANASAWQWWTAVSAYDYKDGLIYIDKDKENGSFYSSKILWALGNYSRFIKPGSVRVGAGISTKQQVESLLVSAYRKGQNLSVVMVNTGEDTLHVKLSGVSSKLNTTAAYLTSATSDLKYSATESTGAMVPPRSIVTVIAKISSM
ncbi:glycoside hydrolase [Pedobacter sp. JY14-1]|uniref:glycoside hydrolase n=1 Tax=Pedobacter sp. JY14-1 TaxID=3034151 RepID=UPI0023E2D7CA|nr:glycoside hydrolase [Pedobacter sp. JY14-1]